MSVGQNPLYRGLLAAAAAIAVGAVIAGVGVAGARESVTIYVSDNGGTCFTLTPGQPSCVGSPPPHVTIQTGDSVTWNFDGGGVHNAKAANNVPGDPSWESFNGKFYEASYSRVFSAPGVYEFVCSAHLSMTGTITVEGEQVETPTPTATATATPSPTVVPTASPAATASADDHTVTPDPGHAGITDTQAPRLGSTSARRLRNGVRVRFWLSEPATVAISARRRGSKEVVASAFVHAQAGTRALVLRSKRFKRGVYTFQWRATDAMGNRSAASTKTLRVR